MSLGTNEGRKIEISFSLPNKVGQLAKALEIMKVFYFVYKLITTRSSNLCYYKSSPFHMIPCIILNKLLFLLLGAIMFQKPVYRLILMSFHIFEMCLRVLKYVLKFTLVNEFSSFLFHFDHCC